MKNATSRVPDLLPSKGSVFGREIPVICREIYIFRLVKYYSIWPDSDSSTRDVLLSNTSVFTGSEGNLQSTMLISLQIVGSVGGESKMCSLENDETNAFPAFTHLHRYQKKYLP